MQKNMESRIGRLGQTKVYVGKCFRIFFNEKAWKKILFGAIISIIVAWVSGTDMFQYQSNTKSGSFTVVCACIWIGIFNSIQSICRERGIIKREHRTGLHISSYVLAHMIFEMIICIIQTVIIVAFVYLFHHNEMPFDGVIMPALLEIFITCFLVMYSSDVLAMAVSSFVKTENAAMTAMPFILIVQLVFSGQFFELSGSTEWISYVTISRWGVEGMCTTADMNSLDAVETLIVGEYEENQAKTEQWVSDYYAENLQQPTDEEIEDADLDDVELTDEQIDEIWDPIRDSQEELEDYDYSAIHMIKIWVLLAFYAVLYGVISVVALEFVDKDRRED